ncbi:MAG: hypothetical protein RR520_06225 [Erysipelotrichaceae bacterium]
MKNSLNRVPLATQKQLLLLAGIVWSFAGFQIFKIGFQATKISELPFIYFILLALLIFIIFLKFIFGNMVLKHKLRIESYETKMPIYHFFDKKGYMIMAFMMSGGIVIRRFQLLPITFISFFYIGLSCALMLSGLRFIYYGLLNK